MPFQVWRAQLCAVVGTRGNSLMAKGWAVEGGEGRACREDQCVPEAGFCSGFPHQTSPQCLQIKEDIGRKAGFCTMSLPRVISLTKAIQLEALPHWWTCSV